MDSYFAVVAPGLEAYTANEMADLALSTTLSEGSSLDPEGGGVAFKGSRADLYRANLHLRTASRILTRLGNYFHATTFTELKERASRLPWERFLTAGQPVTLRVTCHKSKLYHSDAVGRTIREGIVARLGKASPAIAPKAGGEGEAQLVMVRLMEDRCTVSIDSSGELLHRRGYRQEVAKAPLRETLAAGMLLAAGWDRRSSLVDPFCGSGTIPIEAAMIAAGIPPGLHRRFAFMDWPDYDEHLWRSVLEQASVTIPTNVSILAADRDAGAIRAAGANAERAGVADRIEFRCQAISALEPPAGPGWVVTNPPYGQRVKGGKDLRDLYARFGEVLRARCPGWHLAVLGSDPMLLGQMQMELDTTLRLNNGGIPVRLARATVR